MSILEAGAPTEPHDDHQSRSLPAPTGEAAITHPFNSTVAITLNASAPMLDLDTVTAFKINPETGYRELVGTRPGWFSLRFVGVGYRINGTLVKGTRQPISDGTPVIGAWNKLYMFKGSQDVQQSKNVSLVDDGPDVDELEISYPNFPTVRNHSVLDVDPDLGGMDDLDLRAYELDVIFSALTELSFHNATFHIPVKTQAANFSAMQSQATYRSAVQDNEMSPFMAVSYGQMTEELRYMNEQRQEPVPTFGIPTTGPEYFVTEGHVVLANHTELVYQVPKNTTLVEVLGPSGTNARWLGNSMCYAYLNPRPSWWKYGNPPVSVSRKALDATNQTMFLLPIDPEVGYEVRIGGLGSTNCPLSGIRTYPFHYDFSANIANTTTTFAAAEASETSSAVARPTAKDTSTNTTSIIVGTVVGVGGGLVLLGFAVWLLLRRRRKAGEEREQQLLPDPYTNEVYEEPRSKAELEQMVGEGDPRTEESHGAQTAGDEPTEESQRLRARRVVQEEDAESFVEYLPPRYRPWLADVGPLVPVGPREGHSRSDSGAQSAFEAGAPGPSSDGVKKSGNVVPLKQEYARTFGQPLASSAAAGPRTAFDLRDEYKRQFGASAHSSDEQGRTPSSSGPDSAGTDLREG